MLTRSLIMMALFAGCATTEPLSPLERQKLDPPLQSLVLGNPSAPGGYEVTTTPSGDTLYSVIVRTDDPESLRTAGYRVTSTFNDVAVLRVTVPELRRLVTLPSVKNITTGSRNTTQ